ncbi:hypothetical protein [Bradyrhizobium uaiense]|uniref:Uncharacterized protein n=1 Tax=Bradyrhizobium uaiense TaxID=2594946 RepID=A0A6P1BSE8_9BRAD|nr:hypothetical protein [Bradyrhizobium uaiense]NEV01427.1 hypothetical protein [Bradyrhizobium uaiense]
MRNRIDINYVHSRAIREQEAERQVEVARFRAMEQEVTDPLAARLLHEIVEELEADLTNQQQGIRWGSG